jgi:hypothetical protein
LNTFNALAYQPKLFERNSMPILSESLTGQIDQSLGKLLTAYGLGKIEETDLIANVMHMVKAVDVGDTTGVSTFVNNPFLKPVDEEVQPAQKCLGVAIVEFLAQLTGFDRVHHGGGVRHLAAIEFSSATIIEYNPDYPDGECLLVDNGSGRKTSVSSHRLIKYCILQHAYAESMAAPQSGDVKEQYEDMKETFVIKTGFDLSAD